MQANAMPCKPQTTGRAYQKVFDSRKRRVRGLWQRNGNYYANLTVTDDLGNKSSRWVTLTATTLEEAKKDYNRLRVEREDDRLRPLGLTPKLADFLLQSYYKVLDASGKRSSSIAKEKGYLKTWIAKMGQVRLNHIRTHHLSRVLTELSGKYSARSVNLYHIAMRGALKAAMRDGHIKPPSPFEGLGWKRVDQKSRSLFSPEEVDQICAVGLQASKFGRQFVDYLRFMQYSGARRSESLRVRWKDVDFDRGQVTIGAEGNAKNREYRVVDFNPMLEAHLKEMKTRRQPDSQWLFPSPQRGDKDIPSKTFMESLRLTRLAAGYQCPQCQRLLVGQGIKCCPHCKSNELEQKDCLLTEKLQRFGFHDLRHHFISYAVMSGVDMMTVAKWVGHKDGGVLIGKVYGHLADQHRKQQAAKLTFGLKVVELSEVKAS